MFIFCCYQILICTNRGCCRFAVCILIVFFSFSFFFQIKADVETQGEFVKSLIKEVNDAAYQDIEDVVAFVKWLDDELCFLV